MLNSIETFYVTRFSEQLAGNWPIMFLMTVKFAVIFWFCWHAWIFLAGLVFGKRLAKPIVVIGLVFFLLMVVWAFTA